MRNLTKTIAALSLLVPVSAYPLGIGEIKLHSALNQKLNAEIGLLISSGESISDVKVRLAPPEKFDEAGVPWSYFLSKIKFKAVTLSNGRSIVKLTSNEALREPFLDFLLEVTWATGNMYREFTVLVDPPTAYTQPIIPVIQKPQQQPQPVKHYATSQPVKKPKRHVQRYSAISNGQYGPTNRRDYLWKVAKKVNSHSDISVEQMMMALYEANPKAFYKRNVNALMAGKILNIPEREAIVKLSHQQAVAAYKQQDNEWRGRSTAKVRVQLVNIDDVKLATKLVLEAPVEEKVVDTAISVTKDNVNAVNTPVNNNALTATSPEMGAALQSKMDKLEKQLEMMQKMLVLKDEQIAGLQGKKADVSTKTVDTSKVKNVETAKQPKVTKVVTPDKATKKPETKKPVAIPPQVEPESEGLWSYLTLALSALVAGLLGWLWWRKRNDGEELDNESMFASATEISLPGSSEDESAIVEDGFSNYEASTDSESSFLSAFTPTDFDAFDTDQSDVDPIAEADVYLAYGRYQQAEDLMRQAIADEPEREECKLKLLEIFHANENKDAFEKYAEELVNERKHENIDFWTKVSAMGAELLPDSSLFGLDKVALETVDLDQNPSAEDENGQSLGGGFALDDDLDAEADFDLSVFEDAESETDIVKGVAKEETKHDISDDQDNALDFDLSVFDIDEAKDDVKLDDKPSGLKAEEVESIDFDLDAASLNEPQQEELKADDLSADLDLEGFDFTLDEGDKKEDHDEKEDIAIEASTEVESTETIDDFNFDFDTPEVSSIDPVAELDMGVSDLTDMDEMETKIDLARAYIDMADTKAAKSIVEEVMAKGSDAQKASAQKLFDQLKKS